MDTVKIFQIVTDTVTNTQHVAIIAESWIIVVIIIIFALFIAKLLFEW